MRISSSKSEAVVLSWKRGDWPLKVEGESLPHLEEFKYLRALVMDTKAVCAGKITESESKPFNLPVNLCPNSHLCS